jgi:hypothetical protein
VEEVLHNNPSLTTGNPLSSKWNILLTYSLVHHVPYLPLLTLLLVQKKEYQRNQLFVVFRAFPLHTANPQVTGGIFRRYKTTGKSLLEPKYMASLMLPMCVLCLPHSVVLFM